MTVSRLSPTVVYAPVALAWSSVVSQWLQPKKAVRTGTAKPFKDSYVKELSTLDGFEGVYLKSGPVGVFTEGDKWVGLTVSKKSPPRRVYIAGEKVKKSNPNYKNKSKLRIGKTR